jgi:hypothetical protein
VTINLKIEIIKIFSLEFSLSSENKKEEKNAKESVDSKPVTSK